MSKNTFKIGDKVKALSTGRTEDLGIAGQKFTVDRVEPDTYPGPLPVRVSGGDGRDFWLNHEDIKLRGKKPLKVGDKVIVKEVWNLFPAGTEGVVTRVSADSATPYKVEALSDYWFYTRDQLKRVKKPKLKAPAPKRNIEAELDAAWPWPKGTPVRFSESGDCSDLSAMTGLVMGSDGSDIPPVDRGNGGWAGKYVERTDVVLDSEYQYWCKAASRVISALTEEQRTGPMRKASGRERVYIEHSKDGKDAALDYLYHAGDYRDNGDGTGTVLTLEEIFLNSLK